MSASLAFARASAWAMTCEELRSEMAERLSRPTATMVSRTISESVMTKANPSFVLRKTGLWSGG